MKAKCSDCGSDLPGFTGSEKDSPCPKCGSLKKEIEIIFEDTIEPPKEFFEYKAKQKGKKKPVLEHQSGDEVRKSKGDWVKKTRTLDRENDKYKETVIDPITSEIIHHCEEPLSKHFNHGSAKKKS